MALVLSAVLGLSWSLALAPAQTPPPTSPAREAKAAPPVVVVMVPTLSDDRDERALATLGAHVDGPELRLDPRPYPAATLEPQALAEASAALWTDPKIRGVLWLELPEDPELAQPLHLYAMERDGRQVYGRSVSVSGGQAVAIESLANVGAVAAFAIADGRVGELAVPDDAGPPSLAQVDAGDDGGPLFVVAAQAPAPAELPQIIDESGEPSEDDAALPPRGRVVLEAAELTVPRFRGGPAALRLRAGYRGASFAPELPWTSAGELALAWLPTPSAHLELGAAVGPPARAFTLDGALVLELVRVQSFVAGGYRFDFRHGRGLEIAGRLGLEPTRRDSVNTPLGYAPTPPSWRLSALAGADLRASVALREDTRVWLGLGLEVMLRRSAYHLPDSDDGQLAVLSPSAARMVLSLGLDYAFLRRRLPKK